MDYPRPESVQEFMFVLIEKMKTLELSMAQVKEEAKTKAEKIYIASFEKRFEDMVIITLQLKAVYDEEQIIRKDREQQEGVTMKLENIKKENKKTCLTLYTGVWVY